MGASPTAWLVQLELVPCLIQPMSESSGGHRAPVCNSGLQKLIWRQREVGCETSGTAGVTPGCRDVLHLHTGPWSSVGGTMPCTPPSAPVWFRSLFPLIDTRSLAAAVGARGTGRRRRAPRAEVEVSVAPRPPALAPWGTRGWRCPPSPNEVVRSALCLLSPVWGPWHPGSLWWWGDSAGQPCPLPANKPHTDINPQPQPHPNKLHPHHSHQYPHYLPPQGDPPELRTWGAEMLPPWGCLRAGAASPGSAGGLGRGVCSG